MLLTTLLTYTYFKEIKPLIGNTDSLLGYSTSSVSYCHVTLVAVTAYYAIQTRNTVREMKRATEIQFLPSFISTFEAVSSGGSLTFNIKNIGRGPAAEIKTRLSVKENPATQEEQDIQLLEAMDTESTNILFNAGYILPPNVNWEHANKHYIDNQTTVSLKFDYKDILGGLKRTENSIDKLLS